MPDDTLTHIDNPVASAALPICGFWRRLLALLLDVLLLALVGYVLGKLFADPFSALGPWGRLVGFAIALAYFGVLNSRIAGGQTLGKRLMRIYIVGRSWEFIPLRDSILRAAILTSPYFLGPLSTKYLGLTGPGIPFLLLFSGIDVGTVYFFVFNRRTRQSLHDLILRTCVVTGAPDDDIPLPRVDRFHYAVYAAVVLLCMALGGLTKHWLDKSRLVGGQVAANLKLGGIEGAHAGSIQVHTRYGLHGGNRESLIAGVVLEKKLVCTCSAEGQDCKCAFRQRPGCECSAREVVRSAARVLLDTWPDIDSKEKLLVRVGYGYHIGIWSGVTWQATSESLSPAEWRKLLENQ